MKMTRVFAPGNNSLPASFGLLLLRVWLGLTLLLVHGLDKLTHFSETAKAFGDPIHIGATPSLALVVFAEVGCSALLVLGLVTRFAATVLVINFSVAFFLAHHMALTGEHNGELAFVYLAGYVALLFAGPGRYSADAALFSK